MRLRDSWQLFSHTAGKGQSWDLHSGHLASEAISPSCLGIMLLCNKDNLWLSLACFKGRTKMVGSSK